jgi:hypothetical protein
MLECSIALGRLSRLVDLIQSFFHLWGSLMGQDIANSKIYKQLGILKKS